MYLYTTFTFFAGILSIVYLSGFVSVMDALAPTFAGVLLTDFLTYPGIVTPVSVKGSLFIDSSISLVSCSAPKFNSKDTLSFLCFVSIFHRVPSPTHFATRLYTGSRVFTASKYPASAVAPVKGSPSLALTTPVTESVVGLSYLPLPSISVNVYHPSKIYPAFVGVGKLPSVEL